MDKKTKYKYLRNLNITIAGLGLGASYYLKKKNHGFIALIAIINAGRFLAEAYDNHYQKKLIENDEKRVEELTKQYIKEPIK